jgi:hypothetical protein
MTESLSWEKKDVLIINVILIQYATWIFKWLFLKKNIHFNSCNLSQSSVSFIVISFPWMEFFVCIFDSTLVQCAWRWHVNKLKNMYIFKKSTLVMVHYGSQNLGDRTIFSCKIFHTFWKYHLLAKEPLLKIKQTWK